MEEARAILARKWPNVYIHWTTMNQRLDDTEENVEQRKVLEASEGVILPLSNTFYGGPNGFTRYDRNRCLEYLCVAFPSEFSRLFAGPWRRGDTITVPKYITPKYLQIAMLRVKAIFYKEKVKLEKQYLDVLQKQHKAALRQLKELGEKEEE
jgi:hypothetical protein